MLSVNPCLSPLDIEYILKTTTDTIADAASFPGLIGTGRLNAYQACLMAQSFDNYINASREIIANTTWSSNSRIFGDINIQSGFTLTVNNGAIIEMGKDRSITVEPAAKLIVDGGAKITNGCGSMWNGIIVKGLTGEEQNIDVDGHSNQGFVELKGGAIIENAYEALRLWDPTVPNGDICTGGIVQATNVTFRNNRRSAEFMPYYNVSSRYPHNEYPNKSFFHHCTFTTDDNHSDEHPFSAHATAWGVRGVEFLGCTFENVKTITDANSSNELGTGVGTIDAGIIVDDFVTSDLTQYGNAVHRSVFRNLNNGVLLENQNGMYTSRVYHAVFDDCIRGIRNEGVNFCTFVGNDFKMGGNQANIPGFNVDEGIILHQATGFVVEQNTFTDTASPYHLTIGIRADGTGSSDNRIYKNTLNSVYAGNVANRQNQMVDANGFAYGLRYECNSNSGNDLYDICVHVLNGQQQLQGVKTEQGSLALSAGNTFGHSTNIPESDFYNSGVGLKYYYTGTISSNPLYPEFVTQNKVARTFVNSTPNTCATNYTFPSEGSPNEGGRIGGLTFSGYSSAFSSHKAAQQNYKQQYLALIDGGNTDARKLMADTITNGSRLRDSLLAYSPNLSSTVLEQAVKNPLMNGDQKYPVFKTNAEGITAELLSMLIESEEFTQEMLDSIDAARKNLTLRSYLLDTLIYHTEQREQTNYELLRLIQEDTAGFNLNTYREWLDSSGATWAKREMVNTYLHEAKYDTIEALFAAYDTLIDKSDSAAFKNFKDYTVAYVNWMQADSSITRLDSTHLEELKTLAKADEHKPGTNAARNLLNFFYDSTYFTPAYLPEEQFNKKGNDEANEPTVKQQAQILKEQPSIKLYPNPAQDAVTIEYTGVAEGSKLYVSNALGVLHEIQTINGEKGKVLINTSGYTNGIYLARVETEGDSHLKSKFLVLR